MWSYIDARDLGQTDPAWRSRPTDWAIQVFNAAQDECSSDLPTAELLRRYYPAVRVKRDLGEYETLLAQSQGARDARLQAGSHMARRNAPARMIAQRSRAATASRAIAITNIMSCIVTPSAPHQQAGQRIGPAMSRTSAYARNCVEHRDPSGVGIAQLRLHLSPLAYRQVNRTTDILRNRLRALAAGRRLARPALRYWHTGGVVLPPSCAGPA